MKKTLLSAALALREKLEVQFKNGLADLNKKFKNDQGLFQGVRKTYEAIAGFADDPSKREFKLVESTVNEQFDWFNTHNSDYLRLLFQIERTNATGPKAELIVDGVIWGEYTSLELLRLKSLLENPKNFSEMFNSIPVRSEKQLWHESTDENYRGRGIWETEREDSIARTTLKDSKILEDPHYDASNANRPPVVVTIDRIVEIGKMSSQHFTGALSIRKRADLITKLSKLQHAVTLALETANQVELEESDLGNKVMDFFFKED